MLTLDRSNNITCDALEPIVLRFRWEFPDGTPRQVPGEAWGLQIHGPGIPGGQITAPGTIGTTLIDGVDTRPPGQWRRERKLPTGV